jgi:hypothetical protein
MDAAHDFRKRLKGYTATGKGKVTVVDVTCMRHCIHPSLRVFNFEHQSSLEIKLKSDSQ